MKVIVRQSVRGSQVDVALPTEFRGRLPASVESTQDLFTLVVFPGSTHSKVVRSSALRKELIGIDAGARLVVAARQFTLEAREELALRGAVVVSIQEAFWTDESLSKSRSK